MKLIKPSYLIMNQESGMSGLLKHIELCGRTAYKSESEIKEDSAIKFVEMLIKRGHGAVLEHGTVYLQFPLGAKCVHPDCYKYSQNKYSSYFLGKLDAYVTTNYRVLVENNWLEDLQYQCDPTEHHEKRLSVKFICDRGVSHEFVRHRVFSFVQESTRYCNYSKDKFGGGVTFIEPPFLINDKDDFTQCWKGLLQSSEVSYLRLLELGWTPQQARSVLPNSLKTELIMTGTVSQWQGFFKLRCAPDAHPQARDLAIPLHETFKFLEYV